MKKLLSLLLTLTLAMALVIPAAAADQPGTPAAAEALVQSAEALAEFTTSAKAENIQKYGNVTLDLTCEEILAAGCQFGDVLNVSFLDTALELPFCNNYSDVDSGSAGVFARTGDTNVLVAINMGDFATTYGIAVKETFEDKSFRWSYAEGVEGPVTFTLSLNTAGGYYDEYVMHQLSYTNERADYADLSDEQFANFREVATTGMAAKTLYRTATPVNPENNRNTYADAALRNAGVTVVMNLADDAETVASYEGYAESYYSTVNYIALNMGVDFTAAEFQSKLAEGLRFFAQNKGVYAVHCTEGKDRAGFVTALLECLMGASYDEVVADYMVTYYNYYGVTAEEARYQVIADSNIIKTLKKAFGVDDLASADLAACAENYLLSCGLTAEELSALKTNLSMTAEAPAAELVVGPIPIAPVVELVVEPIVTPAEPGEVVVIEPATVTVEPPVGTPANEAAAEENETMYVVVKGDCLWNLAKKFYGSGRLYKKLAEANSIKDPNLIYVGQTLLIPAVQ